MIDALRSRLAAKILAAMATALLLASAASLAIFVPLYRSDLARERVAVSERLGAGLRIALENAMLKRDIDGLRDVVERLAAVEGVAGVDILNPSLEVRFSASPLRLGRTEPSLDALCPDCGLTGRRAATGSAFVAAEGGRPVLRSVTAVPNREPCSVCHGPTAEHPVNGFIVIDYDARGLDGHAWRSAVLLSGVGALVVLFALAVTWSQLHRGVLEPVAALTRVSASMAAGDLSLRIAPMRIGHGDEIAELGAAFDRMATELAHKVDTLREREDFLQGLIDAIPDGVRAIDEEFRVVAANREFARMSGLTRAEVLARPCHVSSHGRDEPCVPTLTTCPVVELAARDEPIRAVYSHVAAGSSEEFGVEVVAAPMVVATRDGPRRFVVESIRDLSRTVQVSLDQRLAEIGQLATGVAHEIHNPLASIRFGLSALRSVLDGHPGSEEAQSYMGLVSREIERCIEITGRLMRLSDAPGEHGTLVDLARIAHDAAALLGYEATTRRIELSIDVAPDARVVASESDMGMVLVNLLQNAFHATQPGGRVRVSGGPTPTGEVVIEVSDTGAGIAADDLRRIFQPFWTRRADQSSGSGLGLPICKALLAKWRGTIAVESAPGVGSTFTLTWPPPAEMSDAA
ncbi:ATP-binding protein [Alsobacter sp. SYSU M60028]|uniref:histidine kinase n=1 Tax=Alsobacter ponti TaxID=2962936 RepID=A0ABT1LDI5_9HYPH|nr:ATP-binding protein [Alsobacter ponti]MCP8939572.1 ATP-binding protein [Alsobacter ponti]